MRLIDASMHTRKRGKYLSEEISHGRIENVAKASNPGRQGKPKPDGDKKTRRQTSRRRRAK